MIKMRYKVVEIKQVLSGQVTCILQYVYDKGISTAEQAGTADTLGAQITIVISNPDFKQPVAIGDEFIVSAVPTEPLPPVEPPPVVENLV